MFTLHSGQMGTKRGMKFTFDGKEVHTPLRSDGDCRAYCLILRSNSSSHSTQVRWGQKRKSIMTFFLKRFTLHSGQMGTIYISPSAVSLTGVHTPLRSDGDRSAPPHSRKMFCGSHSTQVRWGLDDGYQHSAGLILFTLHSGQMGTRCSHVQHGDITKFTLHSGQMGTPSSWKTVIISNLVHTPLRSDGDPTGLSY